jgi:hypothetical protein
MGLNRRYNPQSKMNSSIQAEPDSRESFVFSYGEIVFFFVLIAITKISRTELTIGRIYYLIGPFFLFDMLPEWK